MAVRSRGEAIDWMLFSVGGFVAALILPIHIISTNLLPLFNLGPGLFTQYDETAAKITQPLIRLYIIAILYLPVWHAMHRVRFLLYDLGLVKYREIVTQVSFALLFFLLFLFSTLLFVL